MQNETYICPLCLPGIGQHPTEDTESVWEALSRHLIEFHEAKIKNTFQDRHYHEEKECEHEWNIGGGGYFDPSKRFCIKCGKLNEEPFWLKIGDRIKPNIPTFLDSISCKPVSSGVVELFYRDLIEIKWYLKNEFVGSRNSYLKDFITPDKFKKIKLVSPAIIKNDSSRNDFSISRELFSSLEDAKIIFFQYSKIIWPARDQFGREIWYEVEE